MRWGTELALDSNMMVLYIVGLTDKSLISRHRRIQKYGSDAFDMLLGLLKGCRAIVVTPGVLAETSNLLRYDRASSRLTMQTFEVLIREASVVDERFIAARSAIGRPVFKWLGLVDATLVEIAAQDVPVVTGDFDLYQQAVTFNPACINFDALYFNKVGV